LWWFEGSVELTKVRNEQPAQTEKKAGEQKIEIRYIKIDDIAEGTRLRAVDRKEVGRLVHSFADVGLQVPIRVQRADTISGSKPSQRGRDPVGSRPWVLVSGGHRLEAARQAGHKKVPCIISGGTEADRELGEITENLFRKELTVLELSDQTVRYLNLTNRGEVLAQNVPKPRGGRPRSAVRAAAEALGFNRGVISRAIKIASISKEARAAIIKANLDDHQAKLLKIAAEPTPAHQLAKVAELAGQKAPSRKQDVRSSKAVAGDGSDKMVSAAGKPRAARTLETALAHLLADRLGSATGRFLALVSELGSEDLCRLAAAVQQRVETVTEQRGTALGTSRKKAKPYVGEALKL
jgi:ParB family transcriptional regulator, chromosome partitioning protein